MKSCVLVTGAAGGVGKAFASECAGRGWDVFLTDVDDSKLQKLAVGLRRLYGVEAQTCACDLTDVSSRERLWQEVERLGLRLHMLVNVAGMEYEGAFRERSLSELRVISRLHVEALVETTHSALQYKDPAQTMHIIQVSSLGAFYPMPYKAAYAASKRFILNFSLALREELRRDDIRVMVVCPGGMPTSERSIRGIETQGLMGQLTMHNVGRVVYRSVDLALAGRALYVPGFLNKALVFFSSLVPPALAARFLGRRWAGANRRRGRAGSAAD